MTFPKIKLCWNSSRLDVEWRFGLLGFYGSANGGRLKGIFISGRGLLGWMAGLMFVGYFTGALGLWAWLDRRPYNRVTYTDLILPTRWSGIQKLRGEALVAEGMDDMKAQNWGSALAKLRTGIGRNPDEIKGRLVLANIYLAIKARKQAIEIYDGGLATRYPGRDYVETMLKSAMQSENHTWWLSTCDRALELLKLQPELTSDRKWLVDQKLSVLIAMDRTTEAIKLADAEGNSVSSSINEYRVIAFLNAKKPLEAVAALKAWSERLGTETDPQILRLQVRAYREAGFAAAMDRALEQMRALSPTDPRTYLYGIVQYVLAGRNSEADTTLNGFLLRFGSSPEYLEMLAGPLSEIREIAMLQKLIAYSREHGFDLNPTRRFLVSALVGRGEWAEAGAVLAQIDFTSTGNEAFTSWRNIMHAQIQAALDSSDAAQSNLVALVRGRPLTVLFYKELIANMRRAQRPATAREIITYAQGSYPQNLAIETARKELEQELAAALSVKTNTVAVRASGPEVSRLPATLKVVLNEADFLSRLDQLGRAADYEGALTQVRNARLSKPAWLAARDAELTGHEVRYNGHVGDMLALRAAVRLYNTGDRQRSTRIFEIARELETAGQKEPAIFLLKELLAKVPEYTAAKRLLAEWTPAESATKP